MLLVVCSVLASATVMAAATDSGEAPAGSFEVVARFDGPGPSGIVVTPDGRIFVGFPRHAEDHHGATLGELRGGRLTPFPNAAMSLPSNAAPDQRLVSVHGMTSDTAGNLWVIDDGKRAGRPIEDGAAKVVGFEPRTGRVIASVAIDPPARLPDSHLNDLRVDLTHGDRGTAYVSDSSFGVSPALIVVDLASGRQRRVLATHPSTQPERGFLAVLDGKPLRYHPAHPSFPVGGVDGVTLNPDSTRLYYAPLTSRRLYSIPTSALSDFTAGEDRLAAAVVDEGEKGFADGLATDSRGRIYVTDSEHDAISRRWPDGHFDVVVRDPRIVWADGIFATDRYVYVTVGQWNRLPAFNSGRELRQPPYLLIRAPLDAPATAPAPVARSSAEAAPTLHYWHIWTDGEGRTHQTRCALHELELASMSPPASPQWQDRLRADGATVIMTVQPVGWQGPWHEDPKPQWIVPLSGRWFVETQDGKRTEMGPGEISLGEDQHTRPDRHGRRGHFSGTVGNEPTVLMVVQLRDPPTIDQPCHVR